MNLSASPAPSGRFATFADFHVFYLSEHRHPVCRRLHFTGTALLCAISALAWVTGDARCLLPLPVAGYGCAWVGHVVFEKNRPATFSHPRYSLLPDFALFRDILCGRIRL